MPSGAMVTVPGPDALTVIDLPVALLVRLTNRDPVVLMTVDPSAVMVMVLYSLSTGNAKWTAKPQKVAGRSKGVAAANDRCGSLFAAAGGPWNRIPAAANINPNGHRANFSLITSPHECSPVAAPCPARGSYPPAAGRPP